MGRYLIKKATLLNPGQDDSSKKDILIEDGIVTALGRSITDGQAEIIESPNLHVSPGWLDIGAQHGQPGYEYRETLASLSKAACAGGYTGLAPFPRTQPPIHSRIEVEFLAKFNETLPIAIYPIGAVSQNLEGKDLTEMIDMIHAGAVAFSDGRKQMLDSGLLTRALEYILPFGKPIIEFPLDRNLTVNGQIHEGRVSASMGLTGIPSVAEEITVQRGIQLAAYTGSRLHFHGISAATSLMHIQKARAEGVRVSCDVPAMHLLLEDKDVGDFNSHKKVLPPFRENRDRKALIKGLRDGVVAYISSIHTPLEVEAKDCEFTYAGFGSTGLETAFAAANTALRTSLPLARIAAAFYDGPRQVLGIPVPSIDKGKPAELTLFDPDVTWTWNGSNRSLSKNDALVGTSFTGKVIGCIRGRHAMLQQKLS